jgi:chaperone required for assembly of F1-ATPase
MSEWKLKRFWKTAAPAEAEGGYTVKLDGRSVRTPAKALLVVPTLAFAEVIAAEWNAQDEEIDPQTMPFTRSANAAIDKVATQHREVASLLAEYGESDLLCYRAEDPDALVSRQAATWDPYLEWAAETLEARLVPVEGLTPVPQDAAALTRLSARTHALDPFTLTAFHDLVSLTGSLVLGFAALLGAKPGAEIWAASRLDEIWQIEQWGADEEAEEVAKRKQSDFLHALEVVRMLRLP